MAEEARLRKVAEETPGRAIPSHEHGLAFCATERERERERWRERERECWVGLHLKGISINMFQLAGFCCGMVTVR